MIEQLDASTPDPIKPRLTTVTFERPRCPQCGGVQLHKYRSLRDQGDGSALWWVLCSCGHRFRVLLE